MNSIGIAIGIGMHALSDNSIVKTRPGHAWAFRANMKGFGVLPTVDGGALLPSFNPAPWSEWWFARRENLRSY